MVCLRECLEELFFPDVGELRSPSSIVRGKSTMDLGRPLASCLLCATIILASCDRLFPPLCLLFFLLLQEVKGQKVQAGHTYTCSRAATITGNTNPNSYVLVRIFFISSPLPSSLSSLPFIEKRALLYLWRNSLEVSPLSGPPPSPLPPFP